MKAHPNKNKEKNPCLLKIAMSNLIVSVCFFTLVHCPNVVLLSLAPQYWQE